MHSTHFCNKLVKTPKIVGTVYHAYDEHRARVFCNKT